MRITDRERLKNEEIEMSTGRKSLFALIIVVAALALTEGFCRLLGFGVRPAIDAAISDWHETPDGSTFWVARGPEFNRDGLRDRDHDITAPDGVQRIVCLGDSVTMGFKVARSQTYSFLLEEFMLQLNLPVEVFNVAQSGWSTRQELEAYRRIIRPYRPQHIFVGFCLNDVAEMNNNLLQRPSWITRHVLRHSAFAQAIIGAERQQVRRVEELFEEPLKQAVLDGWESIFGDLLTLRDEAAGDGCAVSLLVFPFRFQLYADAPRPIAQKMVFELCMRNAIPSLDLLPALAKAGTEAFVDDSHLSALGAKIVAEEIIRWGRTGCMMCGHDLAEFAGETCPKCATRIER